MMTWHLFIMIYYTKFEITVTDIKLISKGNHRDYFSSDYERIFSKFWEQHLCNHWTRIEIYVIDGTIWFAKPVIFGAYYSDVKCSTVSKRLDAGYDFVLESTC